MEGYTPAVGMLIGQSAARGKTRERKGHRRGDIAVEAEDLTHGVFPGLFRVNAPPSKMVDEGAGFPRQA